MTVKQQAFCENYIANGFTNATKAALDAGYSKKTAHSIGCENLSKPEVKEYIKRNVKKYLTSRDRRAVKLLRMLEHASEFDIRKLGSWDEEGVLLKPSNELDDLDAQMITEIYRSRDGSIRVKLVSKEKAWEMLAAFTKLINDNPSSDDQKELDDEARKERLSYLLEKLNKK